MSGASSLLKYRYQRKSSASNSGQSSPSSASSSNHTQGVETVSDSIYSCIIHYFQCIDAVGWVAGRASGLYKTEGWGADVVICLERSADLHIAQLMPLPLTVSCFSKVQIGLPFWYRLTRVVPDKGLLNGCVCMFVEVLFCYIHYIAKAVLT